MKTAPRGIRLHIAIFGRRNVGKSSLLNALVRQDVSIVSDVAGTTTDPVEKPMELLPIGPCLFIDTAGIDDEGSLGRMRVEKTLHIFDRADIGIVVTDAGNWGGFEEELIRKLLSRRIPAIVVFNKQDINRPDTRLLRALDKSGVITVETDALHGTGINRLAELLVKSTPEEFINLPTIAGDLVKPGDLAVLVVPIDLEAPKGRLILPQVQTIRDLLDNDSYCMVVKEQHLRNALNRLKTPPTLVITDSQAFSKVAADTPAGVRLTSFSILFARYKGDLNELVCGALAIDKLNPGDRVMIAEACAHHPIADDIGRTKIPRWLNQYVGGELEFVHVQGHDFPSDLTPYKLVVHCGGCMNNRREMLSRIMHCKSQSVPITNYGICIAFSLGILERALQPFPDAAALCRKTQQID